MKKAKFPVLLFATALLFSCSDDDKPTPVNEEEVITTVTATFTATGEDPVILSSRDLDGDGPQAPVVSVSGNFSAGTTYAGEITFLNELSNPPVDITEEVAAEGEEHQVFYQQNGLGAFTYTDEDTNGKPVGLEASFAASETPSSGTLTITLRHEPNKSAAGVANGQITNAGGNTDAEVSFSVIVE